MATNGFVQGNRLPGQSIIFMEGDRLAWLRIGFVPGNRLPGQSIILWKVIGRHGNR